MKRTILIIAIVAFLAIAALALTASAQTQPPASGDWIVTDSTTFNNQQISITGDVLVQGNGHLSLTNVNLRFTGSGGHDVRVTTNARLTISGGSITSSGTDFTMTLGGNSAIDGCTISKTDGIAISTWKAKVTNNTITGSSGDGIRFIPLDGYIRAADISNNRITDSTGYGINISVTDVGTSAVKLICVGNNVSDSLMDGIHAEANSDTGTYIFQGNELYKNMGNGLWANLRVRTVEFRLDDIRAHNNTDYGVYVSTYSSNMWAKYMDRVTSIGNGGEGVFIDFQNQHWYHPVFSNWYVWDNEGGGIQFRNFDCATLLNSYCVNDLAQTDYSVVNTNLEIYKTTHRKGAGNVIGGAYMITSFRDLNFTATWQNALPCRYNTVEFEDSGGNRLFVYTSDYEGHLGNHTQWDWRVRETRSSLRHSITPYLVGGSQRLTGASIEFDRDFDQKLVFYDILTPDLTVEGPGTNHVQNYDNLTIHGKCLDAHSGPKVVQISFDGEPSWDKKFWENASGTHQWNFYRDPAPDAVLTIFVRAFDWANYPNGMYANITITNVTVDTQAPNLTLIQPPPEIITNQSQLTVLGITDPDVVSLTLNGEALDAYGGTFNKAIQLNEGMNNIIIIATDYAGNIANATRQIILDSIQPIVVVKHPINELYTNEITVQMGGITDREGVTMTIEGEPVPVQSDGTWTYTVSLDNGWNFIIIDAVDIALNHRVVTHKIFYDPDPPRINVFEPAENAVINSSVFNIMGSTDPDVNNAQIRVNGIWIGLENSAFNTEFTLLVEGATELEFYAKDWAGNERTIYVPIVIDTTAPTIEDLLPIDGEIVKEHVINVTGSTEEDATVYVNGRYVSLVGGDFVEQINLDEGDNYINILVNDVAKNTRAIHRLVVLDTMPPDVFVDTLVGDSLKTDANFLTITGQTEPTAILFIEYGRLNDPAPKVREEIPVDENGDFSYPVLVGKNKTTSVQLFSTDYAGNTDVEAFIIKRVIVEEPTYFEDHPEVLYGIIIVVAAIVVAFFAVKMGLARTYDRRLKVMGYGTQAQPPPGQAPSHPPPGERPRGPPGAPPRPPSDTPKAPPRAPTESEGGTEPAPRPPRNDE